PAKKEERRTSTSIRNEVTNTSTSKVAASKDSFASRSDFDGRTRSLADSEGDEKSSHASPEAACDNFSNSEDDSDNDRLQAEFMEAVEKTRSMPFCKSSSDMDDWIAFNCKPGRFGKYGQSRIANEARKLGYVLGYMNKPWIGVDTKREAERREAERE